MTLLTILQIRKKNNRADIGSNVKQIVKNIDLKDVTKEFLDNLTPAPVSDEKIVNERNRNTDSI